LNFHKLNIDKKRTFLHIVFWLSWIVSFTIIQSLGNGAYQWLVWFAYYIITLPIFVAHTYIIAYVLLPLTFFKGKYLWFAIGFILLLIMASVIELIVSNEFVFKLLDVSKVFSLGYLNIKNIIISGIGNLYIVFVFFAIKAGRSWYLSENEKEELLQTKMETDLEIYRYQLQPKLIYTLISELEQLTKKDPTAAPEMIVNISNFLNRFLFEGKEEMHPLQLETQLIEEFLEIHKQALKGRLKSNFIVNGILKSFVVPPLLLIPFINSAIKLAYECNNSFDSSVIIKAEKKYVLFSFAFWSDKEFRLSYQENIEITKKRLKYSYPGKHRLIENIDENFREVSLEIFF
jgi:two-component system LytT family sensor kinase